MLGLKTRILAAFLIFLSAGSVAYAQDELPPGDGRETVARVCGECHGLAMITSYRKQPREGWEQVVADMVGLGAVANDTETKTIIEYLVKHFGKEIIPDPASASSSKPPPEKLNVNKATAKEMETFFQLSTKEADDLVHYREQYGRFKDWEALMKVPGLDAKRVEKSKDRVTFDDKAPD
jgi:competence ComEA-like helix-hairpin-helix protein